MREFKYQNESGTKKGKWYLNRLDYFEFHQFPRIFNYKLLSVLGIVAGLYLLKTAPWLVKALSLYIVYVSMLSLMILHKQVCKWKGYLLYPSRFVEKLKLYRKAHDESDFDSLATLESSGAGRAITRHKARQSHLRQDHEQ